MKRVLLLLSMLLGLAFCAGAQNLETLLERLDRTIEEKDNYSRKKEERIDAIRSSLAGIKAEDRYGAYDALYGEYAKYNLDSALHYAGAKAAIARDKESLEASRIQLADIYTNAGQYQQAEEILRPLTSRSAMYYHALHTLYAAMAATSVIREKTQAYTLLKEEYRDSLIANLAANDIGYIFALSEKLNENRQFNEALTLVTNHYNDPETSDNDKAILDYCMAISYRGLGNREKAKWHYAASAISDIRTPVKEYKSLQELSYMLYQEGDFSRAYRYISCAMEDVQASNTIVRSMEFYPFLSTIGQAYEKDIKNRNKIQQRLMLVLCVLLILLIAAVVITMRQQHMISRTNRALVEVNQKLEETGYLKDEYLYQYMEQTAAGIDRMESYRRRILLSYRKYGADHLASELESPLDVEAEQKDFYNSFDQTFLHIFPGFVADVNRLLNPQMQLEPKPGRLMNTELRILALIRLGVTDNVKIAHFLRTSLSTVYNYRSKLRNASTGDQTTFEDRVAKIGIINIDSHE